MNITKHGNNAVESSDGESFKCPNCGCEFVASFDEYYVERGSCFTYASYLTYSYHTNVTDTYACSCPECHRMVTKAKQRTIESPTITLNGTIETSETPDPCKNCSNNPDNGGSGICHCILGNKTQITC